MRNFHWIDWNGPFHELPPSKLPRYGCAPGPEVACSDDCEPFTQPQTTQTSSPVVSTIGVVSGAPCQPFTRPICQLPLPSGASGRLFTGSWLHSAIVLVPVPSPVQISMRVATVAAGICVLMPSNRLGPPMLLLVSKIGVSKLAWTIWAWATVDASVAAAANTNATRRRSCMGSSGAWGSAVV